MAIILRHLYSGSDGKAKSSLCKAREPKQRAHSPLLEAGLASESKTD